MGIERFICRGAGGENMQKNEVKIQNLVKQNQLTQYVYSKIGAKSMYLGE